MSKSKATIKNNSGFLLLEVLVCVTVIAVGLIYVVRSFSSSTRGIETATRFLKSVSLAEEKLWDLEAKGTIERGRDEGRFKDNQEYKWRIEAEEVDEVPINLLKLKVEWEGVQRKQRVSVETYLWNEED